MNESNDEKSSPAIRRKMRQGLGEATDQINIRGAVSDINAFVDFCEANRYTLGQGLREIVRLLPRPS